MSGLIPLGVIAEFLGQRPEEMRARIDLDGLPVIRVPARTRDSQKVALLGLHRWLAARTKGEPLTVDQLELELERCARVVRDRLRAKGERIKARKRGAINNKEAA